MLHIFQILNLACMYALLYAFLDIYYIKNYRNLTKKDKKITIFFKSLFVAITGYTIIIKEPLLIVTLVFTTWLIFDSLMGLYLYNNIFAVGKNSVMDDKADMLDKKDDQRSKPYFFIKLIIILISIVLYECILHNWFK